MMRLVSDILLSASQRLFHFLLLSMQERAPIRLAESIVMYPQDCSRRVMSVRRALDCHWVTALQTTSHLPIPFVITADWVFMCVCFAVEVQKTCC